MVCNSVKMSNLYVPFRSYIHALEEDARYAEAKLRDVWRRHIRNPDDRGNPQLSAVLQVSGDAVWSVMSAYFVCLWSCTSK